MAITRRPKSWRVNAAISSRRWVSMCGCSGASAARRGVVRGEVGCREGSGDELADPLAIGPAAGLRAEPAHDLAHVARRGRAGRGDSLVNEGLDLVLGQLLGEVFGQDRDLRLFLGGQILAGALAKRLDRLTPGLDLPCRSASPDRIAVATSDWIRSRSDTGMAPRAGVGSILAESSIVLISDPCEASPPGRPGVACRDAAPTIMAGDRLNRPLFGRSSCALLPCAFASRSASRSARAGEPRRGCRSAGSSC